MNNLSKTAGYLKIDLPEGQKTAHFGMNFIKNLKDLGYTLSNLGKELTESEGIDQYIGFSKLLYAGFRAFDDQNGLEVNYNQEKCLEWTLALKDEQIGEFQEAMMYCMALNEAISKSGKTKREKNPQS